MCHVGSSISQVSRQTKLNLLACVSAFSDYQLQELGLQLRLGDSYLQTDDSGYSILLEAQIQLSSLPAARHLYLKSKKLARVQESLNYHKHLDTLSVQCGLNIIGIQLWNLEQIITEM